MIFFEKLQFADYSLQFAVLRFTVYRREDYFLTEEHKNIKADLRTLKILSFCSSVRFF